MGRSTPQTDPSPSNACPSEGARRTKRSRRLWLGASIGVQAVLLAAGLAITFGFTRAQVAEKFRDEILSSNIRTAQAVSERLATQVTKKIAFQSPEWESAQSVIESLNLPAGGYACIIDDENAVLCHPDIRKDPGLRNMNLGDQELVTTEPAKPIRIRDLSKTEIASGKITFNGIDTHYVASRTLPGLNARILVHQPVGGLLTAGEAATSGMLMVSVGIGGVVLLSTGVLSAVLMRRHDRELECINQGLEAEVSERVQQALGLRDALIFGLAKLADYRDTDTGTHLERIAEYCVILCDQIAEQCPAVDDSFTQCLRIASAMHDIGKVGVEDEVLLKPGKLTDEERLRMQRHPNIGADTLIAIRERMGSDELIEMSIVVALQHHERWDGKGYPLGIAGDEIQLPARIVALADVYDALTSKRVYKPAMDHDKAVSIITEGRGSQFDPLVVDAYLACADRFEQAREQLHRNDALRGVSLTRSAA